MSASTDPQAHPGNRPGEPPPEPPAEATTRLEAFCARHGWNAESVEPLVQDAGERMYFRLRAGFEDGATTRVLCVMARPYEPGTLPFANSAALYREAAVAGPLIHEEAPDLGVVLLQDLGDDLLQELALRGDPRAAALYTEAVEIIARIQREGARIGASDEASRFRAFQMRLDHALFLRELRFFVEHFVTGYLGVRLPAAAAAELDRLLDALAEEAAGGPEALCHRDYHSRNLIALPESEDAPPAEPTSLRVIDHQDTRLGPRGYDLMSFARDPYVAGATPLPEEELTACFLEAAGIGDSAEALAAEFDAVALQRHLKALGTYGFQVAVRGNAVYRRFIAPTTAMVRQNLDRWRERDERRRLAALLADSLGLDRTEGRLS